MALVDLKPFFVFVGWLAILYGSAFSIRTGNRARWVLREWILNSILWVLISFSFLVCSR